MEVKNFFLKIEKFVIKKDSIDYVNLSFKMPVFLPFQ